MLFKNPIIPGYNPDPSICRVGSDYYIVNSTFEFFPGVPVYHSKNLVNWELTGYCLDRRSQLELEDCRNSGGIYAPTIRYHKGMFYMITTNVTDKGNFVVHTEDINSEWSEPAWIDQGGIDPSLFFDDDDKCYYCSTGIIDGVRGIVAFEINPLTGVILSEKKLISEGCGGQCPEGPHIYKKDGWYYLMIAEGGTEYAHRETIQRSHNVYGPYEACPDNPVISHKEYKKSEIQATGHADLLEDENGNWWLVFLGIRRFSHALLHNLGRETFLAKVEWEDGWPIINRGVGKLEDTVEISLPKMQMIPKSPIYSFAQDKLDMAFLTLRNPDSDMYELDQNKGVLKLALKNVTLKEQASPAYVALRQRHQDYQAGVQMRFTPGNEQECAGIAVMQSNEYHIRFEKYLEGEQESVRVISCVGGKDDVIASCKVPKGDMILKIVACGQKADFCYQVCGEQVMVACNVDIHFLSTEVAGGFVGCTIGMYASSNGTKSDNYAEYGWMFYEQI